MAIALVLASAATPAAQSISATPADIRRLLDGIFEARNDIARLRTGDAALRTELSAELDDIHKEVIHLKSGKPMDEPAARTYVRSLLDRIDRARHRARGSETVTAAGGAPGAVAPPRPKPPALRIPPGTKLAARLLTDVRLRPLVGEPIEAAIVRPFATAGQVIIPAGSLIRGEIIAVARGGQLSLHFDQILVDYYTHLIEAAIVRTPRTIRTGAPNGTIFTLRVLRSISPGEEPIGSLR